MDLSYGRERGEFGNKVNLSNYEKIEHEIW